MHFQKKYSQWLQWIGGFFLLAFIVIIFSAVVPYNDDEFLTFTPLICALFPGNAVSRCNLFDLTLAGTNIAVPLRSFFYSGSIEAFLYLPIHLLWSSPIAVRLFHMCFFVAGALLLARKFEIRLRDVMIGLGLLFPYVFVHLVDTGIGNTLQIFSIYVIFYLIDEWTRTLRWKPAIIIGLLLFLGFWEKFSYVWYVPGISILFHLSVYRHRRILAGSKIFYWQILSVILVAGSLSAALLFSDSPTSPGTYPYVDALIHVDQFATPPQYLDFMGLKGTIHAFYHPLDATQRIYYQFESPILSLIYSVIVYLVVPVVLIFLLWFWKKKKYVDELLEPLGYYCAFIATTTFILLISKKGGMHHSILSYPFLILSFLGTWKVIKNYQTTLPDYFQNFLACFVIGYVSINALFFLLFPLQPVRESGDPMRFLIHKIIKQDEIAERYLVYIPDWGTYLYTAFFGSQKESIIFGYFYSGNTEISVLQKLAVKQGRKLMVVYSPFQSSGQRLLSSQVKLEPCSAIPENASWQILAEPDPLLTATCKKYEWVTDGGKKLSRNIFVRMWLAL